MDCKADCVILKKESANLVIRFDVVSVKLHIKSDFFR